VSRLRTPAFEGSCRLATPPRPELRNIPFADCFFQPIDSIFRRRAFVCRLLRNPHTKSLWTAKVAGEATVQHIDVNDAPDGFWNIKTELSGAAADVLGLRRGERQNYTLAHSAASL
jgi:hypothetical protein